MIESIYLGYINILASGITFADHAFNTTTGKFAICKTDCIHGRKPDSVRMMAASVCGATQGAHSAASAGKSTVTSLAMFMADS